MPPRPLSWPIERRESKDRIIQGRSRAIFLLHQLPQFHRIDVYADGAIKYGIGTYGYDLGSFLKAADRGSISASLRHGQTLLFEERLSGLGSCEVDEFRPLTKTDDLIVWVKATIEELNPGATDLLDFHGQEYEDIDPRNPGIRRLRTVIAASAQFLRYDGTGNKILGRPLRAVIRDNAEWRVTDWMIYADGASQLGPTGPLVGFRDVVADVLAGRVASSVPEGQWINMDGLGLLKPKNVSWWISPGGLVAEAEDILARLQGGDGVVSTCLKALRSCMASPSPETRESLRASYDLVPTHMREPCLGRDEQAVRSLLGLSPVSHTDNYYS